MQRLQSIEKHEESAVGAFFCRELLYSIFLCPLSVLLSPSFFLPLSPALPLPVSPTPRLSLFLHLLPPLSPFPTAPFPTTTPPCGRPTPRPTISKCKTPNRSSRYTAFGRRPQTRTTKECHRCSAGVGAALLWRVNAARGLSRRFFAWVAVLVGLTPPARRSREELVRKCRDCVLVWGLRQVFSDMSSAVRTRGGGPSGACFGRVAGNG